MFKKITDNFLKYLIWSPVLCQPTPFFSASLIEYMTGFIPTLYWESGLEKFTIENLKYSSNRIEEAWAICNSVHRAGIHMSRFCIGSLKSANIVGNINTANQVPTKEQKANCKQTKRVSATWDRWLSGLWYTLHLFYRYFLFLKL